MKSAVPVVLLLVCLPAASADPAGDWPFDVVRLSNGTTYRGLLVEETSAVVKLRHVRREPGRPTVCVSLILGKWEVAKLDKLSDAQRDELRAKLDDLGPEAEARRLERIDLLPCDWNGKPKAGRRYDSDYFSLVSCAPEDTVRRAAARLEQIATAYARFLPPRHAAARPTLVRLVPTLDEYKKSISVEGKTFLNLAFYEPAANRIVCGTDLQKLGEDLQKYREQHRIELAELADEEAKLRRLYGGRKAELARLLAPIAETRKDIAQKNRYNDGVFDKATDQLFRTLYHEAFHAYVGNFVYPPCPEGGASPGELPRWLNEGMAQVFETALVEAGDLRIGHAEPDRLARAKESLKKGDFPPVRDLLRGKAGDFVVNHAADRAGSDRAYLASWAAASYLMFDRRILRSGGLDGFVKSVNDGGDAEAAFAKLVGQGVAEFDRDFRDWLARLKPDGTLTESKK